LHGGRGYRISSCPLARSSTLVVGLDRRRLRILLRSLHRLWILLRHRLRALRLRCPGLLRGSCATLAGYSHELIVPFLCRTQALIGFSYGFLVIFRL